MFFNFVNLILKSKETEIFEPIEQDYQDHQPDIPYGPKLAEVPDQEDIPSQELIPSLDFNPKLSKHQRSQLEEVVK